MVVRRGSRWPAVGCSLLEKLSHHCCRFFVSHGAAIANIVTALHYPIHIQASPPHRSFSSIDGRPTTQTVENTQQCAVTKQIVVYHECEKSLALLDAPATVVASMQMANPSASVPTTAPMPTAEALSLSTSIEFDQHQSISKEQHNATAQKSAAFTDNDDLVMNIDVQNIFERIVHEEWRKNKHNVAVLSVVGSAFWWNMKTKSKPGVVRGLVAKGVEERKWAYIWDIRGTRLLKVQAIKKLETRKVNYDGRDKHSAEEVHHHTRPDAHHTMQSVHVGVDESSFVVKDSSSCNFEQRPVDDGDRISQGIARAEAAIETTLCLLTYGGWTREIILAKLYRSLPLPLKELRLRRVLRRGSDGDIDPMWPSPRRHPGTRPDCRSQLEVWAMPNRVVCAVSGECEWEACHVVPWTANAVSDAHFESLGMPCEYRNRKENLLPLQAGLHTAFDKFRWGLRYTNKLPSCEDVYEYTVEVFDRSFASKLLCPGQRVVCSARPELVAWHTEQCEACQRTGVFKRFQCTSSLPLSSAEKAAAGVSAFEDESNRWWRTTRKEDALGRSCAPSINPSSPSLQRTSVKPQCTSSAAKKQQQPHGKEKRIASLRNHLRSSPRKSQSSSKGAAPVDRSLVRMVFGTLRRARHYDRHNF